MTKGIQLMSQIAALARQAAGELESAEDKQAAIEIKLAAECVVTASQPETRNPEPFSITINSLNFQLSTIN